jgi:hypothetical protein
MGGLYWGLKENRFEEMDKWYKIGWRDVFCTNGEERLPQQLDITCSADRVAECEEGSYNLELIGL